MKGREREVRQKRLCGIMWIGFVKCKVDLRLSKLQGRNTKQKMRSDFQWDGDDANLADKVLDWVKTYLFSRYKFLKKG